MIEVASAMPFGRLYEDATAYDAIKEPFEFAGALADLRFDSRGRIDVAERDLKPGRHRCSFAKSYTPESFSF